MNNIQQLPFQKIDINSKTSFFYLSFKYLVSFKPKVPIIQRSYIEERVEYFYNIFLQDL